MSAGASVCPGPSPSSSPQTIDMCDDTRHWRFAPQQAERLGHCDIDWFALRPGAGAELVKHNSQRDVWLVDVAGYAYFAKIYRPNGVVAKLKLLVRGPVALREWAVGQYAAAHSIKTVVPAAMAWAGSQGRGGPSLLVTEAVPEAEPLNEYWLRIRDDRRKSQFLTDALARLIARAHQCGFQHQDMHPGNILIRPDGNTCEAFFVDLHSVRIGRPVPLRSVIANLAQLNQWFRRHATRTQRRRFLRRYMRYRDEFGAASPLARNIRVETAPLTRELAEAAERHARQLWAKRDRRTRRTGKYFARIRRPGGWRGHVLLKSKHPAPTAEAAKLIFTKQQWKTWLADPLSWIDPQQHTIVKNSHTATICKAMLPTEPQPVAVIVKRPLARNFAKRLVQMFGPSRNMRAWRLANMMLNRDLPAAQPLAVIERYALRLIRLDSISLTDFVSDAVDLEGFLTRVIPSLPPSRQREVKDRLIDAIVQLIKQFHMRGFIHRDLKAPNLLVRWSPPYDGAPELTFIDMDGIRYMLGADDRLRTRALVRLCVSLLESPAVTASDRLRFLQRYLTGPGQTPRHWKTNWRTIHEEVCAKLKTKQIRREWKLAHYGRE